jgi:hypothetical protein
MAFFLQTEGYISSKLNKMSASKSIGRRIKIACLGMEILVSIVSESGKWNVERGFKDPLSTFYIPPSNLKEVVGHDYCPSP